MRKFAAVLILCLGAISAMAVAKSVYDFTLKSIDGKPESLAEYHAGSWYLFTRWQPRSALSE